MYCVLRTVYIDAGSRFLSSIFPHISHPPMGLEKMAPISARVDRVFRRLKKSKITANEGSTEIDQASQSQTSPEEAPLPAMAVFPGAVNNTRMQLPVESVTTPNPPTTSITLEQTTTKPPIVEENADRKVQVDPWTLAIELFQERNYDQELVSAYTDHLGFVQGDGSAGPDLSRKSSVENVVEKLLEDRDQKQWKITIMDRDIKIRSQLERLAKFLSWSDPVVKTAVSTQPYAALAWSGVCLILPLLTSGVTQNADMLEGFNNTGDLQMYWKVCEQEYLDPGHRQHYQSLIEPLAKLYSYIIEYHAQVIHHLASSQASRAWTDMKGSAGWSELTGKINNLDEHCRTRFIPIGQQSETWTNMEIQLQELRQSRATGEGILHHIVEDRKDEEERKLLNDLARAAGDYTRYKDINPERVPGTCEWFLKDQRFSKWRSSSSDLLWVSAGPGCGKSVLSKTLVDEGHLNPLTTITITPSSMIPSPQPVVAYFFFKEGGDGKMDYAQALCALLHQIFTIPSTSSTIRHALPTHKANGETLTMKPSELWRILTDCATASENSEIICVVDALDECEESSRIRILDNLEKFYSNEEMRSKSKLKFLITSRPYEDLEYSFGNFPKNAAYMRLDGDEKSDQIRKEIDLVIDAKVEFLTRKFENQFSAAKKIKTRLKSMEHRTYLWLYLTLNYIEERPAMYSKTSSVERLLSHLPSTVADAYERMLSRYGGEPVKRILLHLVLAAERPLTLLEANIALTLALREQRMESHADVIDQTWSHSAFEDVVKQYCGLFISIHDSRLSFIHQTAREFLLTKRKGGDVGWGGSFNLQQSHETMSQVCLDYLFIPDIGGHENMFCNILFKSYPFRDYSGNYWPSHTVKHGHALSGNNLNRVRMLCDPGSRPLQIWTIASRATCRDTRWTSLGVAAYLGLKQIMQLLLEDGAEVNEGSNTPIQIASEQGDEDMVQMLLENGADISGRGSIGTTALRLATSAGHLRIVEMLLEHGANVDGYDIGGDCGTALPQAARAGNLEIVETLLKHITNVDSRSKWCSSALLEAMEAPYGDYKQIVEILLSHGAAVNFQDQYGRTALMSASYGGLQEIVQTLLSHGADIHIKDKRNGTALQDALRGGHQQIAEMLLAREADTNTQSYDYVLEAASGVGHQQIVQLSLARGANPNVRAGFWGSALHAASRRGHQQIVQILLSQGANPNFQPGQYGTPLQAASSSGHQHVVETLINHGAKINFYGEQGAALQQASGQGHQHVVETLLSHGADVNHQENKCTALYAAAGSGHDTLVKILLDHDADVDTACYSSTALHTASESGHRKGVELLLDHGADIETAGYGETPLYAASGCGHLKVVKILLDRGAVVNSENRLGYIALHAAAGAGRIQVVEILLSRGADVNATTSDGTALCMAARGGHENVVQILLDHGADINATASDGTALWVAAKKGHEKVVQILLKHGAIINAASKSSMTALYEASMNWNQKAVEILLMHGAATELGHPFRGTALHAAAETGHFRIVEILLDYKANPNFQDEDGHTALHRAAEKGHKRIVGILLEKGASVGIQDNKSRTPLQLAAENGHQNVIEILEKHVKSGGKLGSVVH